MNRYGNDTIKRFLAFLLCLAMIITYMPPAAYTFADESADDQPAAEETDSDAGTDIVDTPTPTTEPPTTDITDSPTPLAGGVWALMNMISAMLTTLGGAAALFRIKEGDDEDEDKDKDEKDNRGRKMFAAKAAGALAAVAAPVTFFLTEDVSLPMTMIDRYTGLMLVILAVQIAAAALNKKASKPDDGKSEAARDAAN